MVALAMNGFTSRTVLFSLVSSVALSFAPQVSAQETGAPAVAAQETARRQQAMRDAMQQVQEARLAYTAGRYSEAVEHYQNALAVVPKAPATEKHVQFIKASLADALVAKGMDYRKVGRRDEAIEFMKEAMQVCPGHKFAAQELEKTQDPVRTNPALSPQHVGDVAEVNRLLSLAYGYYDLGLYEKASETFDAILRVDSYNTAAQRGKELIAKARTRYTKSGRDAARAKALSEVDAAWEEPVPAAEDVVMDLASTESGAVVQQDAETENRIAAALKEMKLPQIVFEEATVKEVVEALQGQIRRFEGQGLGAGRKIILLPNFGAVESEGYKTVMSRRVNLNLNDVSLHDLLNILDSQLGITHYITPLGVELSYSGRDFGPLVERVYTVPPHFFDAQREEGGDEDEDDFSSSSSRVVVRRVNPVVALKEMGVSFPEGATARYDASSRLLTVRNTAYNQEEIEELISMPLETDRAVVLNVIAMEVNESDLNELGFEWMFNFSLAPKSTFLSGVAETALDAVTADPASPEPMPSTSFSATEGLRSGRSVLTTDNVENLIKSGRAGMYDSYNAAAGKAPGIFSFRGVWNSGDVTMIMRGAAQKKGADVLTNPRIVFTPGRDEQVLFANIREMFYPETYAEPQISTTSFNLGTETSIGLDGQENNRNVNGRATIATPAHPESFIRFGTNEDAVGGVGSVVQIHDASVAPDGRHVTMALTVTLNEFEGFVNWGTPIYSYMMTDDSTRAVRMTLTENQILKPVFKRRMENTKLTVGSGAVVVIGGLKESRSVRYEDKLPVLGDLPMVGRLFRSEGEEKIRKAFLMFVKVDVVDPTGRLIGTGERPSDVTD